jgi:uncharacterized damage-inducible protein DinB
VEINSIDPFLKYFENIRERTMRVSRCVPSDKADWSYAPGKFTLGDRLRHIAVTDRYLFAENIQGHPSRYTTHGRELAENLDSILAFIEGLHAESMSIFAKLSYADLQRKCPTVGGVEIPAAKLLRSMTEHEIHHRGQLYVYLGILGVAAPPLYGLTSEDVRARSRAS